MKKIILLATCTLMSCAAANAQISIAPEVGINLANERFKTTISGVSKNETGDLKLGVKAGANVNIPLGDHLVIQPGLFYSIKGTKHTEGPLTENRTLHYFDVPVNIQYMFNDPSEGRFFIGVGPYLGVAFSGHDKLQGGGGNDITNDLKFGNDAGSNDLQRFDFGGQVNAGYLLRSGIFFRGMYQAGITNLVPQGNSDNTIRNSNITISVGYQLGSKPKDKGPKMKGSSPM